MTQSAGIQWLRCLAPEREFAGSSLRWVHMSLLTWSLYKCGALWMAAFAPSATEKDTRVTT